MKINPRVVTNINVIAEQPRPNVGEFPTQGKAAIGSSTSTKLFMDIGAERLLELMKAHTSLVYGAKLSPTALTDVNPEDVLALALNTRFAAPVAPHLFPATEFNAPYAQVPAALPVYALMSSCFSALTMFFSNSTNPEWKAMASDCLLLLRRINYAWTTLVEKLDDEAEASTLVFASRTVTTQTGAVTEVFIDSTLLPLAEAVGWTPQTIADYWVANKQQVPL